MNKFGAILRSVALVGIFVSAGAAAAPALAAQADIDFLKAYMGDWKGRGVLVGADTETVVCKMNLSSGNEQKINYSGKCTLAGSNLSIKGTLAYVDASKRYEALEVITAS